MSEIEELTEMLWALINDWTVKKTSLWDEEGVEGWIWTDPQGGEHCETGDWSELPPWPESAHDAFRRANPHA